MTDRLRHQPAVCVLLTCVLLASCSGERAAGIEGGDDFSITMPADPGNLDPHHAATYAPAFVLPFAYESLITREAGVVQPGLARSWTSTPHTVTYTLRDDVTCADGTALTVADVADNFRYIAAPANGSLLLGSGVPLGTTVASDTDAHTVTLTSPDPQSFLLLQTGAVPIVCRRGLVDRTRLTHGTEGTGLFQLTSMIANDHYIFSRRSNYRSGVDGTTSDTPGVPRTVTFRIIANPTTAANLLLAGQLTSAAVSGPDRVRLDAAGFATFTSRSPAVQMWFNQAPERVTSDVEMRRALAMAIDTRQVARVAGGDRGLPPRRLAAAEPMACSQDTSTDASPAHDPVAARALLERAGWRVAPDGIRAKGSHRLSLSLIYDRELIDPVFGAAAAELAISQWRAVGVDVHARAVAGAVIGEVLFGTSDYDISWVPIIVPLPTRLLIFTSGPMPPRGTNFAHLRTAVVPDLARAANQIAGDQSCSFWNEIERAYLRDVAAVPIMDADNAIYAKKATFRLGGISIVPTSIRLKDSPSHASQAPVDEPEVEARQVLKAN